MSKRIFRYFFGTALLLAACNEKKALVEPESLELERAMNLDNYLIYHANKEFYDRIEEKYSSDTVTFKEQHITSLGLGELSAIIEDVCSKYRSELLSTLNGRKDKIAGDTLNLKDIDFNEKTKTKEYVDKFKNDIRKLLELQKKLTPTVAAKTCEVCAEVESQWNKKEYTTEQFITHLTITENLLLTNIYWRYDNLFKSLNK